ncbi:EamA family transporter [Methylobacterium radiotolerans]|uniref:EamA family transporter n=1 Tax=Methylobacterium radiotolerans TaxID=31998 RepID=UPI0038D02273
MTPTLSWQTWALLSAVFTALTTVLARAGVAGLESDVGVFVRSLVIAAVLGVLFLWTGGIDEFRLLDRRSTLMLILSGFATAASWACLFRALRTGTAAGVATLNKLSLVMVAILGVATLGERLSALNWLGLGLATLGAYLMTTGI